MPIPLHYVRLDVAFFCDGNEVEEIHAGAHVADTFLSYSRQLEEQDNYLKDSAGTFSYTCFMLIASKGNGLLASSGILYDLKVRK